MVKDGVNPLVLSIQQMSALRKSMEMTICC